jgi:hypothetical protein
LVCRNQYSMALRYLHLSKKWYYYIIPACAHFSFLVFMFLKLNILPVYTALYRPRLILLSTPLNSLLIKLTDALNSKFIGITTLHVSGSLSAHHQEFLAVHRHWYFLCSFDEPFAIRSRMELILLLIANGHHNCIKCTSTYVRLRTPDDGRKACPKHVEW